jgi:hypothetical protein
MSFPGWYAFIILALAAWRTFQLIAHDDILDPVWKFVPDRLRKNEKFVEWVQCPYCMGFWITLIWWGAWQEWPRWTLIIGSVLALHAGMIAASKFLSPQP